jgi:molybdate transport system substrate-binding protein
MPDSTVQVWAAGSLREAFTDIALAFEAAHPGTAVALTLGASGLLRERVERMASGWHPRLPLQGQGDHGTAPAQAFASADKVHPQRLAAGGGWQVPMVFTRNTLCALTLGSVATTPDDLLETLLRAEVRVGMSTPGADPSGDYAWELFGRSEAVRPGARALLEAKALQLTGSAQVAATLPEPPPGRSTYAWIMEQGLADVF